ncbi:MAG: Thermophilic serine proteinase precursor, partial [Frankiales bacterium]|nr:Thermophilic serine proteinase precursor [Frankiales bacterium]
GGSLGLALAIQQVADDAAAGVPVAVANMSLGGPFRSRVETEALAYAARVAPQVLFVAASGNDGGRRPSFPAAFPGVLSVGASERGADGRYHRAAFSTTADVDVLAPGVDVTTYDYLPGQQAPALGRVSGTSEATPAVAGLVAGLASGRDVRGQQAAALLKASAGAGADGGPGDGSGRADALSAAVLGDGSRGYSTVFADLGAQVEAGAVRSLVVQRYVPATATATPEAATLTATTGVLVPGAVSSRAVDAGTLVSQRWTFGSPDGAAGLWQTADDDVPYSGLPPSQGEHGLPVRSGERLRSTLGQGRDGASLVSFSVQQGQTFTVVGSAPADGAPLYLWAPAQDGGTASSYDEPAEQVDLAGGSASYRAPVTGRYVVGHLAGEGQAAGTYEVGVAYPEPVGRVSADAVSTSGRADGLPRLSWAGAQRYDVQWMVRRRTSDGWVSTPWRTWLPGTAATSAVFGAGGSPTAVVPGTTYHLRVVPYDGLGGVGAPSASVAVEVPFDDRATGLRYSPGWSSLAGDGRWRGTLRRSSAAGSSVTATLEASSLTLVADRGPASGQADVVLDGVRVARVDLGAPALQRRAVVWRSGPLPGGIREHTLRVVVLGTPGRPQVTLDGLAAER